MPHALRWAGRRPPVSSFPLSVSTVPAPTASSQRRQPPVSVDLLIGKADPRVPASPLIGKALSRVPAFLVTKEVDPYAFFSLFTRKTDLHTCFSPDR